MGSAGSRDVFVRKVADERKRSDASAGPQDLEEYRRSVQEALKAHRRRSFGDRLSLVLMAAIATGAYAMGSRAGLETSWLGYLRTGALPTMTASFLIAFPGPMILAATRVIALEDLVRVPVRVSMIAWLGLCLFNLVAHFAQFPITAAWLTAYLLGVLPLGLVAWLGGSLRSWMDGRDERFAAMHTQPNEGLLNEEA